MARITSTYIGRGTKKPVMTSPDRDEDTGRFTETYPRAEFLDAIRAEGGMAGTTDVAERVGVIRETAYKKLQRMEADGEVESRKVGNSLVWLLPENPDE